MRTKLRTTGILVVCGIALLALSSANPAAVAQNTATPPQPLAILLPPQPEPVPLPVPGPAIALAFAGIAAGWGLWWGRHRVSLPKPATIS